MSAGLADVAHAKQRLGIAVEEPRAGCAVRLAEGMRVGAAGEHRRLDERDVPEVDEVRDLHRVCSRHDTERGVRAPVPEERVALRQPERGVDPELFERRSHRHGGVEAGAESFLEHFAGRAHALAALTPACGRLGIADVAGPHRVVDGGDDRVDPNRILALVRVEVAVAGVGLHTIGCLDEERTQRGRVWLYVRRQELKTEMQRIRDPLVAREDVDVDGCLAERRARGIPKRRADAPVLLHVDLEHACGVEHEFEIAQRRGLAGLEVDQVHLRIAE
ncbi:hypothetical protein WBQ80_15020 [Agromyces sp. CCNWLW213]|uniref:hypothetical protein n=1 Tax=Agromyces sp. CCNWLW213 TaxID=3128541 RepID=UPI0030763061